MYGNCKQFCLGSLHYTTRDAVLVKIKSMIYKLNLALENSSQKKNLLMVVTTGRSTIHSQNIYAFDVLYTLIYTHNKL